MFIDMICESQLKNYTFGMMPTAACSLFVNLFAKIELNFNF